MKFSTSLGLLTASLIASNFATAAVAKPAQISPQVTITYSDKLETEFRENYGIRERATIEEAIRSEIAQQADGTIARVEVNVIDVTPNRPTFEQLGARPGLSYESFSRGGAVLSGKSYDASGNLLRETNYQYTTMDIWNAQHSWVWQDAEYAIYGFTRRLTRN
ncbi:MAG: hypothetical protein FD163_2008 [Hyphomonadaceae bacterium]|nr:MAG: hypothetical protein FD128_1436 [Hyphomonadaceae bacterium]KAF0183814.1 MAG: hypothetical protein FD163_2008 [Hyphomonadaceae bacterium]